jgi:hypothetical protein
MMRPVLRYALRIGWQIARGHRTRRASRLFWQTAYCDSARVTKSYWFDFPEERNATWDVDGFTR